MGQSFFSNVSIECGEGDTEERRALLSAEHRFIESRAAIFYLFANPVGTAADARQFDCVVNQSHKISNFLKDNICWMTLHDKTNSSEMGKDHPA